MHAIAKYDPWFLERIAEIIEAEEEVCRKGLLRDAAGMRKLKSMGFSDKRLAWLALKSANLHGGMDRGIARAIWADPRRGGGDDRRRDRG